MELLTVTCERDLCDMLLQAYSIDKFIQDRCKHHVVIEDGSKSFQEWKDILSPYYTNHDLVLHYYERPDLDFIDDFIPYPHRPDAKSGIGGIGWRRQQVLKMAITAELDCEAVLVLDSKNIFVRPTVLESWPVRHGNGEYLTYQEIQTHSALRSIKDWVHHLRDDWNLVIPDKFAMILETPFVWQTSIVKDIWAKYPVEDMFMNLDVIPNSEFHMYFFFVPPKEVEETYSGICRVVMWNPKELSYETFIQEKIDYCDKVDSPTHGLHRQTRQDMTQESTYIYRKWLTNKGLDAKLVDDYIEWCR